MPSCLYPTCDKDQKTRGLCSNHYSAAVKYIKSGDANEQDLINRNLMLARGAQRKPRVKKHDAFLEGSNVKGEDK